MVIDRKPESNRFMRSTIVTFLLVLTWLSGFATVRLPSILASGMVLQRSSVVKIWGWANAGEIVTVSGDWLTETMSVTTGNEGRWSLSLPTGPAGGPHEIVIEGTNKIVLHDILFGEVWLCSGQSNMEFTLRWLGGWKRYKDEKKDIKRTDYSRIRLCRVSNDWSDTLRDSCGAAWQTADEKTVLDFSATAWFFGKNIYNMMHVPVGLIVSSIGGTPAESWTRRDYLENDKALNYFLDSPNRDRSHYRYASVLYNAMINPIVNYRIKGAIWYQGESNRYQADLYTRLLSAMIRNWREVWQLGDFPFYLVQIAPFDYHEPFNSAAWLREAQYHTLSVPNTGMAVTMDIGNPNDIHPVQKQEVGLRLALLALSKTYGYQMLLCEGPELLKMKTEGKRARLFFKHADDGLMQKGPLNCFQLAGKDLKFYHADAAIDGNSVTLVSDSVKEPVFARYAFADADSVSLFNLFGLPAVPFRTDTIPLLVRPVDFLYSRDSLTGTTRLRLKCSDGHSQVRYTFDNTEPVSDSPLFTDPLVMDHTCVITARAFRGGLVSPLVSRSTYTQHAAIGKKTTLTIPADKRFPTGPDALVDGVGGSLNHDLGCWQGFEGCDFEAVIDLGSLTPVSQVCARFLQNTKSWVFLPASVSFSLSADGLHYTPAVVVETIGSQQNQPVQIKEYRMKEDDGPASGGTNARYVKVVARNIGTCPSWHPGKGGKSWIFVDEVMVN